jgi:nickel-dependent lactate racemase
MEIKIPWQAWYGETELALTFPHDWRVTVAAMRDAPTADAEIVARALRQPFGAPSLQDLARQHRQAVIVVEDITRPLDTAAILPTLLAELDAGGIVGDNVWFIIGLGAHTPMNRADLVKKLGLPIVQNYVVHQNTPYENLEFLGQTTRGTPVHINRFFRQADLRISVGTLTPHAYAGFGAGAKTVAVGVAGIETLFANHGCAYSSQPLSTANVEDNVCRADLEEIATMAGLHYAINGVINSRRELVGIFAGDLVQAHRAAVACARQVSATQLPPPADIAIFNAYPKDTNLLQSINALNAIGYDLKRAMVPDGTPVLTAACPDGAGFNYLESVGMRLYLKFTRETMGLGKHGAIVFSLNLSYANVAQMYPADTRVHNQWDQVIAELRARHGERATVNVFPCGALQIPAEPGGER